MTSTARLCFVAPLDVGLIVQDEVSGLERPVVVGGRDGLVHLPVVSDNADRVLVVAPSGFKVAETDWGSFTSSGPTGVQVAVNALGFSFALSAEEMSIPSAELALGYAKGTGNIEEALRAWLKSLVEFGQGSLGQPLNRLDPSPKILSAPHSGVMQWVEQASVRSWVDSSQLSIIVIGDGPPSPRSERAADSAAIDRILALANTSNVNPPPATSLVSSARIAAQRARWRLSLMELGTAAEALFTDVLALGNHKMTLGVLVDHVATKGIALPPDVKDQFVNPRNNAVHNGQNPTPAQVDYALSLLDQLVASHYPTYSYDNALPVAFRPQRHDLHVVLPPKKAPQQSEADVGRKGPARRSIRERLRSLVTRR